MIKIVDYDRYRILRIIREGFFSLVNSWLNQGILSNHGGKAEDSNDTVNNID